MRVHPRPPHTSNSNLIPTKKIDEAVQHYLRKDLQVTVRIPLLELSANLDLYPEPTVGLEGYKARVVNNSSHW